MSSNIRKEKALAYLLRHDKNYAFDEHGWREVSDLVENYCFSIEDLDYIVANSCKQRFEFSEDKRLLMKLRRRKSENVEKGRWPF